jgi:hypothetical protein
VHLNSPLQSLASLGLLLLIICLIASYTNNETLSSQVRAIQHAGKNLFGDVSNRPLGAWSTVEEYSKGQWVYTPYNGTLEEKMKALYVSPCSWDPTTPEFRLYQQTLLI